MTTLLSEDKKQIRRCARSLVEAAVRGTPPTCALPDEIAERPVAGLFVSLFRGDELRACVGNWADDEPQSLEESLRHAARAAATSDRRFDPSEVSELAQLTIEISVLHNLQRVEASGEDRIGAVEVGKHGLILEDSKTNARGLLLPQVATERGWDARTFLEHTVVKAGLAKNAWRKPGVELTTFEVVKLVDEP